METAEPEEPGQERRPEVFVRCTYRPPDADFYCWKYGVWYNLMDCCYRHDERTYSACGECGQGRSNLRQNIERYRSLHGRRRTAYGR